MVNSPSSPKEIRVPEAESKIAINRILEEFIFYPQGVCSRGVQGLFHELKLRRKWVF
jgi:hypothetical protein